MTVEVNSKKVEFNGTLLSQLLTELNMGDTGYAVAVGSSIVPRGERDGFALKEGDSVTIIVATHGG